MKTYLLLICSFLIANNCSSQIINDWNLDFEEWNDSITTPDLVDTIVKDRIGIFPSNWYSNPDIIPFGKGIGQTTDAQNNEFAVALSGFYQFPIMRIITGTGPNDSGWPIDYSPKELNGFYKAILPCSTCDSLRAYVDVYLTIYDSVLKTRDTIGQGHIVLKETDNEYKDFNIPIDYKSNNAVLPDSITMVIAKERFGFGSQSECWECSHVFFDDFSLPALISSIAKNENDSDGFEFYPNPSSGQITIKNTTTESKHFQIFDLNGQIHFDGTIIYNSKITIETKYTFVGLLFISDGKSIQKVFISN